MIIIICPVTGQKVATGVRMSADEFARAGRQINVLRCPACGRVHEWTTTDAELQPEDPRSPDQKT